MTARQRAEIRLTFVLYCHPLRTQTCMDLSGATLRRSHSLDGAPREPQQDGLSFARCKRGNLKHLISIYTCYSLESQLTFTAANDKVLICSTKRTSNHELLLLVARHVPNNLSRLDCHELNSIFIHANEHDG